ncbi:hypothetical protein NPIL_660031 [Nephila pilipes]|uniref:Uncharacterized protein n=1 Tax=Nephila pilipes TaxID=299642 RepID=A0A8X6T4V7_NEPPI|nr:hypothetical protein NPIL_660031 [Nephila pilipes]
METKECETSDYEPSEPPTPKKRKMNAKVPLTSHHLRKKQNLYLPEIPKQFPKNRCRMLGCKSNSSSMRCRRSSACIPKELFTLLFKSCDAGLPSSAQGRPDILGVSRTSGIATEFRATRDSAQPMKVLCFNELKCPPEKGKMHPYTQETTGSSIEGANITENHTRYKFIQ